MWGKSKKRLEELQRKLRAERVEIAQMRRERANDIQAVHSGARTLLVMGKMLKMVADE